MPNDDDKNKTNYKDGYDPSRRKFIKNTGMVVGGIAGGSILGGLLTNQYQSKESTDNTAVKNENHVIPTEARMFFTRYEDFVVLEQATERIYPENDDGPGAIELGVPYFIDKQLAGSWGTNTRDYRQGPYPEKDPTVDQSSLTRGEIFIAGLRKLNQISQDKSDTTFDKADKDKQIEILQDFEDGNVKMKGIGSDSFFSLLRDATIEGVYADPLYGGNRNMAGWKMKEYPGSVSSYANVIEKDEFVSMEPVSLTNYQQKSERG